MSTLWVKSSPLRGCGETLYPDDSYAEVSAPDDPVIRSVQSSSAPVERFPIHSVLRFQTAVPKRFRRGVIPHHRLGKFPFACLLISSSLIHYSWSVWSVIEGVRPDLLFCLIQSLECYLPTLKGATIFPCTLFLDSQLLHQTCNFSFRYSQQTS